MIGAAGSRHHLTRGRRSSSPCLSPQLPLGFRRASLTPQPEEVDEDDDAGADGNSAATSRDQDDNAAAGEGTTLLLPAITVPPSPVTAGSADAPTPEPATPRDRVSSITTPRTRGRRRAPSRLSTELPAGVTLGRRRAVTTTDHKTCALLHTRLKGIRLEDIANSQSIDPPDRLQWCRVLHLSKTCQRLCPACSGVHLHDSRTWQRHCHQHRVPCLSASCPSLGIRDFPPFVAAFAIAGA